MGQHRHEEPDRDDLPADDLGTLSLDDRRLRRALDPAADRFEARRQLDRQAAERWAVR